MNIKRVLISAGIAGTIALTGACTPSFESDTDVGLGQDATESGPTGFDNSETCEAFSDLPIDPFSRSGSLEILGAFTIVDSSPEDIKAAYTEFIAFEVPIEAYMDGEDTDAMQAEANAKFEAVLATHC